MCAHEAGMHIVSIRSSFNNCVLQLNNQQGRWHDISVTTVLPLCLSGGSSATDQHQQGITDKASAASNCAGSEAYILQLLYTPHTQLCNNMTTHW